MASELTLSVNGAKRVVSSAPDTPLLFVMRNELKLTGPRLGCGMAQCGACSVLVDGEEVRSCVTPVADAVGKQVTTIAAKTLHPVQQAWIDEQVPQCGYCQSGMMIAAVDLLTKNSDPTVAQIKDAYTNQGPSPHLCRCGTYAAIIDAVQRAAKAMKPEGSECHECVSRIVERIVHCNDDHPSRLRQDWRCAGCFIRRPSAIFRACCQLYFADLGLT
jgi:isoquinoline 1-oxidoreductase alpha subunit